MNSLAVRGQAWSDSHPLVSGGIWVDRASSTLHIELTGASALDRQRALDNVGNSADAVVDRVAHTEQQLAAVDAGIVHDRQLLASLNIHTLEVGEAIATNQVVVTISPSDATDAESVLNHRYGSDVLTIQRASIAEVAAVATVNRYGNLPPVFGGMEVNNGVFRCTAGFNMIETLFTPNPEVATTAGHWFNLTDPFLHFYKAKNLTYQIGQVDGDGNYTGSIADGEFAVAPNGTLTPKIITQSSSTAFVRQQQTNLYVGATLCKSGVTTNQTCGFIVSQLNVSVTYDNNPTVTFSGMLEATNLPNLMLPGDSGGPAYYPYVDPTTNTASVTALGLSSGFEELCQSNGTCMQDGNYFYTDIGNFERGENLAMMFAP